MIGASAVAGAVAGASLVLGADALTRDGAGAPRPDRPARPLQAAPPSSPRRGPVSKVLLAWAPGGLPAHSERALEEIPGVNDVTTVIAGLDWLQRSTGPDGAAIDAPPRGYAIPLEMAIVEPREYARFVPAPERDLVLSLKPGEVLLAETEAALRGAGEGVRLRLDDRTLTASAVVSDAATNGYEALLQGPVPAEWTRADRFVLVRLRRRGARAAVERKVRALVDPGIAVRVRSQKETPYLRYADAVQPQMILKANFGEFAARPLPDGTVEVDRRWVARNIRRASVPVLGEVACHRALFPQLRGALREIVADGIDYLVDPQQYAGCYSPRFIDRRPGGRLSHHAWGVALDLNYLDNAFGTRPDQDRRLVQALEEWGFTWGGRWLVPDGMHFEWTRWP